MKCKNENTDFLMNNPTNELIVNNKSNSYKHMITTLDYRVK